jgi:ADP-heptose:LPS heptosyltransferase
MCCAVAWRAKWVWTKNAFRGISGTDVMILKIFSPKHLAKILAFFCSNYVAQFLQKFYTLVFEKNANFSPLIGKNRDLLLLYHENRVFAAANLTTSNYNATGSLARFENKNIFFCCEKSCSQLHIYNAGAVAVNSKVEGGSGLGRTDKMWRIVGLLCLLAKASHSLADLRGLYSPNDFHL